MSQGNYKDTICHRIMRILVDGFPRCRDRLIETAKTDESIPVSAEKRDESMGLAEWREIMERHLTSLARDAAVAVMLSCSWFGSAIVNSCPLGDRREKTDALHLAA